MFVHLLQTAAAARRGAAPTGYAADPLGNKAAPSAPSPSGAGPGPGTQLLVVRASAPDSEVREISLDSSPTAVVAAGAASHSGVEPSQRPGLGDFSPSRRRVALRFQVCA